MIQIIGSVARRWKLTGWRRHVPRTGLYSVPAHGWVLLTALVLPGTPGSSVAVRAAPGAAVTGATLAATDGSGTALQQQDAERAPNRGGSGEAGRSVDRAQSIPSGGDYVLEPTDIIDVHIEDAPELSKKFTIASDGTISMEYLKTITVGGNTCQQLERTIADGLRGRYLRDPHVTVTVLQSNSPSYYIQGAVHMPVISVFAGHPTLMKPITIAGGLADTHGSTAFIIREASRDPKPGPAGADQSSRDPAQASDGSAD